MANPDESPADANDGVETGTDYDELVGEVLTGMVRELRNNTQKHCDSSVVDAAYFTVTGAG